MYSPKIDEELVRALYQLKQTTKKPMTALVNQAIMEFLIKMKGNENEVQRIHHQKNN